jgi:hypothetical protein
VKAKSNFHHSYFPKAKLLFGLYDYKSKHLGILEEINATTPTNLLLSVLEKKIHMQMKYNAGTFLGGAELAPFFGSIKSRTTPCQEEEDDVHRPSRTYTIESRTTAFQEEDDVHMLSHTYIIYSRMTPFQEGEDDWTSHESHKRNHQIHKLLHFKDILHVAILKNSNKR